MLKPGNKAGDGDRPNLGGQGSLQGKKPDLGKGPGNKLDLGKGPGGSQDKRPGQGQAQLPARVLG